MIYLFFFLKFKSQLRKTRPDIVAKIEDSLIRDIADAGGKITGDRFVISAVFNEDTIGFWLDIFILIENLKTNMESSKEFFGYSLVITGKQPDQGESLCRFLANYNGVFTNEYTAKKLVPYAGFEKPSEWLKGIKRRKYGCTSYYKIKELKTFKRPLVNNLVSINDAVNILGRRVEQNTLIIGPEYSQVRNGLYEYCKNLNEEFPPLVICFGSMGLGALVDCWSSATRALASEQPPAFNQTEDIDNLWEFLYRERIRDEVSEYVVRTLKRFLCLVFEYYYNIARKRKRIPLLVIENIHLAGNKVAEVLITALREFEKTSGKKLRCLGTCENGILQDKLAQWEGLFTNTVKMEKKPESEIYYPKLSNELWEIIYSISLFSRYFSPELIQRLFEEDERNPVMITRAFSILHGLGIIDNIREPRLVMRHLEEYARKVLKEKCSKVNELVRSRLLSWAERRNLNPCFRLLTIIAGLNGSEQIDDLLLLKSFSSDIINETIAGIETAMRTGQFEELVSVKAEAIRTVFKTLRALYTGNEYEVEKAFKDNSLENLNNSLDMYPVFKSQILVNYGAYYLGKGDLKAAADKIKEAILLGQSKNHYCLAQGYRVFSLVCLSKQQALETIEYLGFALNNAERAGNYLELSISAYYAAAAQFLYGDIFNCAKLAKKSVEQSLAAGRSDWADRSCFLQGRLEFELGHYKQAYSIFDTLRKEPFGSRTREKDSLLAAWMYRCKVYFDDFRTPKPEEACHDADLFEIEAAYFSGDYKKAVDLAENWVNPFLNEKFLYTEQADWRSGFAQCEHLYFTNGEIQDRMIALFHSLALSRLTPERSDEAAANMQKILRDEKLCEMDPLDAIYFFAKYKILEQAGASHVDLSTLVSMAFKRLQRRAGRIEDIETRRQYLIGSKWNSELSAAAKEFKLI